MTTSVKAIGVDEYSRHARLKPAFLVILPVGMLVSALGLNVSVTLAALSGPMATLGLTFLLAQVGRDFGKRKEGYLYSLWTGKPTITKMRHRDTTINTHTRDRYHQKAAQLLGISLPNADSERSDPQAADALYEAYGNLLLERTRDQKKFPLIFQELTNYGFRRNLWGMKPIGLTLNAVCLLSQVVWVFYSLAAHRTPSALTISSLLISAFLLASWTFLINPEWVRIAANAYAERLLASSEMLQQTAASSSPEKPAPRRRTKNLS